MECRENCGACCVVPSISSKLPAMPGGKPAGVRCPHLLDDFKCEIFNSPDRPKVCGGFKPESLFCGKSSDEAYRILSELEGITVVKPSVCH